MTEEQQDLRCAMEAQAAQMHLAIVGAKTMISEEYYAEGLHAAVFDYQTAVCAYILELEASLGIKNLMDAVNPPEEEMPF